MSTPAGRAAIHRILVALDASRDSLAALEAAADLARVFKAELLGLFVEDVHLLEAARLPFTREIRYPSAAELALEATSLEQALRSQASEARGALEAAARRVAVRHSFRIARGEVETTVLAAAREVDLLVLGRVSRPARARARMGSTARAAVTAPGTVLLSRNGWVLKQPVALAYSGSAPSDRALRLAAGLAGAEGGKLIVLLAPAGAEDTKALEARAAALLEQEGAAARYEATPGAGAGELCRAAHAAGAGMLVLAGDSPLLRKEGGLEALLDEAGCPVLIVR